MSIRCQVTGKKFGYGKQVSHSHVRTNRRWLPHVQRRRCWLPSEGRRMRLRLSAKAMKTIDSGIEPVVAEMRACGNPFFVIMARSPRSSTPLMDTLTRPLCEARHDHL